MDMITHLEALAQKDPDQRRQALVQALEAEGLSYTLQEEEASFKNPRGVANYLLTPWQETPCLLFCAHYDAVPGSFGANDNAASLCILIALAKELKMRNLPARFAFFDGEENGNAGSRFYAAQMDKSHETRPVLRPFCDKALLDKHNGQVLKYLPKSDEVSFAGSRIPTMSLCVVPRWDIQYLKAMATYGDGFLGRPPEFDMMLEQMEVITTMHGGYRDNPQYVEEDAMMQVYEYLLEGVTAPPAVKKRFGLL